MCVCVCVCVCVNVSALTATSDTKKFHCSSAISATVSGNNRKQPRSVRTSTAVGAGTSVQMQNTGCHENRQAPADSYHFQEWLVRNHRLFSFVGA